MSYLLTEERCENHPFFISTFNGEDEVQDITTKFSNEIRTLLSIQLTDTQKANKKCKESSYITSRNLIHTVLMNEEIRTLMEELKNHDSTTYVHSIRVGFLSCLIGLIYNYKPSKLLELTTAGVLHDIGKLNISSSILQKNGRLSFTEYSIIKNHPRFGLDILEGKEFMTQNIQDAILSHHENEDGTGYPMNNESEKIPQFAKILHIADVFDALISERPYKKALSYNEATFQIATSVDFMFNREILTKISDYYPYLTTMVS